MIFLTAFAFVVVRDLALIVLVILAGDLLDRYLAGEPLPFFGEASNE